ncbi:MAG: helix-turn-helix domain-containing protein [Chloroflexota bacterium]
MPASTIDLTRAALGPWLGEFVRSSRRLIGWTQDELATRARTSQATIWRIECGRADHLDLNVVERVFAALGARVSLAADVRHLADRERQADGVHAVLNGASARRHARDGWSTASEVQIGRDRPRGWIDLLAFRPADNALVVQETKCDLVDFGALQRSLAFYEREAVAVARDLGWTPRRVVVLLVALDTASIAARLRDNRDLVDQGFPAITATTAAWLKDPTAPAPRGWTLAMADPASQRRAWLRPPILGPVRREPAYLDYAGAARRLLRS